MRFRVLEVFRQCLFWREVEYAGSWYGSDPHVEDSVSAGVFGCAVHIPILPYLSAFSMAYTAIQPTKKTN